MRTTTTAPAAGKSKYVKIAAIASLSFLLALGVFGSNGWLPRTDPLTGKRTGWFGSDPGSGSPPSEGGVDAAAADGVVSSSQPSATPQLSKEYIYAGSRLLAVEDANATAAPPADIAVWRPSSGYWMVMGQAGSQATNFNWGISTDIPTPGDYDGDGKTDFAIWRPSSGDWWVLYSSDMTYGAYQWGISTDLPAQADYNGGGRTDFALYRPSTGQWWVLYSDGGGTAGYAFGNPGDIPGGADFTGDGRADLGVYRPANGFFYVLDPATGQWGGFPLGVTGVTCPVPHNCVVPSDYDGDGRADPAVYDASNSAWAIRTSGNGNITSAVWGFPGNLPVQNDYDGDGKTDLAVWNNASPAMWSIKRSSNGTTRTETFGTTADIPVPAFYRR